MDKLLLYFKQTLAVPRDDDDDDEELLYFLFPPLWGWFWPKCFTNWLTFIFLQSQVLGDLDEQNTRRWEINCPMCNAGVRTALILCGTDSTMYFLWDFCLYWNDSLTLLLLIYWLHVHDVNLPFQHIPKVLYRIEIRWLWRPFYRQTSLRWLQLGIWCLIFLEAAIRGGRHCLFMVGNNTQVDRGV